jgi:hypothetical protein
MPWNTYFPSRNTLIPQSAKPVVFDGDINDIITDSSYRGLFYAYGASGGFFMEKGVQKTTLTPYEKINKYDVTNSLQVTYDVRTFNTKLGLIKDVSNIVILDTSYNPTTGSFPRDEVQLSATEFALYMKPSSIISVGKYATLYSDFQTLLNNYFGFPEGFNTLFDIQSQITINGGVFDSNAMIGLMNYGALNASGEYVKTMTGSITVNYVNALLRYACLNNPFNNRTTQTLADGFIENDLVYVPTGTTVTLVANIVNIDTPNNYVIPTSEGLSHIIQSSPGPDYSNGHYSQTTTFTSSSITRVVNVPMLIVLKNLS